jgi:hypothetical protein
MVLALPEDFFKDWEYKDGDMYYLIDDDEYDPSSEHGLYVVYDGMLCWGCHDTENWICVDWNRLNGRPVPNQRQLQDILMAHKPHKVESFVGDLHALFFNFRTWIQNDDEDSWWDFRDELENFDQAWLCYAMEVLYNKNWNGEKWI